MFILKQIPSYTKFKNDAEQVNGRTVVDKNGVPDKINTARYFK